jgi:EmrB/QacA subfamily drug resistance transporter
MTTARMRADGTSRRGSAVSDNRTSDSNPWHALWAMMVGFFMILLDSTIVAVANPRIMTELKTGYAAVIWVTSAYLLAYAVPLLVAGRLGDRYGPKNLYLSGLAIFTAASLWCGLSGSIGMLIAARVIQGIGAAVLTPQTLSTITRIFPPQRRGAAMSVWGATAGVATLVGPLAGGILVDALGWKWIFFVNVPIGIIGLVLAVRLIPALPTHRHRFDLIGVALSGIGMFLVVFALQQGEAGGWAPWIWAVMVAGVGLLTGFVYWQSINAREPLIPLAIFRDRDFSLSSLGVAVIGFVSTAMVLPLMFYAQAVCGLSPTRSALLLAPMAICNGVLAPVVGRIVDRSHPRPIVGFGFSMLAVALTWLSIVMTPATPIWQLVLPFTAMGVGMAFIWSPLAATATRNLAPHLAGASSGVYNATRQVGAVLGSAGMAAFMTSQISAEMPFDGAGPPDGRVGAVRLPEFLHAPFAAAMSMSMLLPAFIALFGVAASLFLTGAIGSVFSDRTARLRRDAVDTRTERITGWPAGSGDYDDGYDDEDDYVEYTLPRPSGAAVEPVPKPARPRAGDDTQPLSTAVAHARPATAGYFHSSPAREWQHLLDEPGPAPIVEPISHSPNGSHVDDEDRFRPITGLSQSHEWGATGTASPAPRHVTEPPRRNKHHRADSDDPDGQGRRSSPDF